MSDKAKVSIKFEMIEVPDEDPDLSYLQQDYADIPFPHDVAEYRKQDAARLAAYNNGEWSMVGIKARATITVMREECGSIYHIDSPGLWGIESDSGRRYFKEVYKEQRDQLRADLAAIATALSTGDMT